MNFLILDFATLCLFCQTRMDCSMILFPHLQFTEIFIGFIGFIGFYREIEEK